MHVNHLPDYLENSFKCAYRPHCARV